jgi:hypothetical protein
VSAVLRRSRSPRSRPRPRALRATTPSFLLPPLHHASPCRRPCFQANPKLLPCQASTKLELYNPSPAKPILQKLCHTTLLLLPTSSSSLPQRRRRSVRFPLQVRQPSAATSPYFSLSPIRHWTIPRAYSFLSWLRTS